MRNKIAQWLARAHFHVAKHVLHIYLLLLDSTNGLVTQISRMCNYYDL